MYLPFNAVHAPLQAPEEDIKQFNTGDSKRDILMGMLKRMDIAVGDVDIAVGSSAQDQWRVGKYTHLLFFR